MWLNIHYIWNPKIPENSKTSIYYAQDSLIWSSGNYLRAAGSGGKRDKTDRWGKGELSTVWGNNCMVNTAPVAESIPVQSSWQVGGGWVVGVGDGVSTRGVRLLIGKERFCSSSPFSWFCGNIMGTRITSAHCQLRRKSMIAVSLSQKEVRPVEQQEFPGLFARKASLASFAGWVRARGIC